MPNGPAIRQSHCRRSSEYECGADGWRRAEGGGEAGKRVNLSAICTKFTNKLIEEKPDDTISVVWRRTKALISSPSSVFLSPSLTLVERWLSFPGREKFSLTKWNLCAAIGRSFCTEIKSHKNGSIRSQRVHDSGDVARARMYYTSKAIKCELLVLSFRWLSSSQ